MENTNVKLSEDELLLVTNAEFILTKNRIIAKVYELFGKLSEAFSALSTTSNYNFPNEVIKISPKIYKGEQYEGLPYVMLDYPRYFTKDAVFAIRSFFWWGNFFSISLHLSGKYQQEFLHHICKQDTSKNDWLFDLNTDEWSHKIGEGFTSFSSVLKNQSLEELIKRKYIKLAKKIPLSKWDETYNFFLNNYKELLNML